MIRAEAEGTLGVGLFVLDSQFHCNPETLPVSSSLNNIINDAFWRQTERTYLRGQCRCGSDLTSGAPQVHDFDFSGVKLG